MSAVAGVRGPSWAGALVLAGTVPGCLLALCLPVVPNRPAIVCGHVFFSCWGGFLLSCCNTVHTQSTQIFGVSALSFDRCLYTV